MALTKDAQPSRLIRISEAADLVGVHADTLRRWDKSGAFRAKRTPSGQRFYDRDELEQFVRTGAAA